jgi:hypothetical protein
VVVADFDIFCILTDPAEAETPLVIDADAVLSGAIASQGFEAVTWRNPQMIETRGGVQLVELHLGGGLDIAREFFGADEIEDLLGFGIGEAPDHWI